MFHYSNDWKTWALIYFGSCAFVSWLQGLVDLFVWLLVFWFLVNNRIVQNTDTPAARNTAFAGAAVSFAAIGAMGCSEWLDLKAVMSVAGLLGLIGAVALSGYLWWRSESPDALPKYWLIGAVIMGGSIALWLACSWNAEATFLHLMIVHCCMMVVAVVFYSQCDVLIHPEYQENTMVMQSVTYTRKSGTAFARVSSIAGTPAVLIGAAAMTVDIVLHVLWTAGGI